jgi:hypothetical protein
MYQNNTNFAASKLRVEADTGLNGVAEYSHRSGFMNEVNGYGMLDVGDAF